MPILIGVAAVACRRQAGAATSAEAATALLRIVRRVALSRIIMASSLMIELLRAVPARFLSRDRLFQLHGLEVRRRDDLKQLAVVGIVEHGVLDARRLQPGCALVHGHHLSVIFAFDPALEDVDHLQLHVVIVPLRHHLRIARRHQADNMRLQEAIGGLAHTEIAVPGVAVQAVGPEVFCAEMADVEGLLQAHFGLCFRFRARRFSCPTSYCGSASCLKSCALSPVPLRSSLSWPGSSAPLAETRQADPCGRSSMRSGQQLGAACAAYTTASATSAEVRASNFLAASAASTLG